MGSPRSHRTGEIVAQKRKITSQKSRIMPLAKRFFCGSELYSPERDAELRSDLVNKWGVVRGWLMAAAVLIIVVVYLVRHY